MMNFRFVATPKAPGHQHVEVYSRDLDDEWGWSGGLDLTTEEWRGLRDAIMIGKGDRFGIELREE